MQQWKRNMRERREGEEYGHKGSGRKAKKHVHVQERSIKSEEEEDQSKRICSEMLQQKMSSMCAHERVRERGAMEEREKRYERRDTTLFCTCM